MKNSFYLIVMSLIVAFATSCNNTEDQQQQENEPFGQNPTPPDSLQLDSLTSDSVDYNEPESPRM
ncbi:MULTISPECIES: hypothetical protein [Sphingobacterium]|uniref:Cytochrome C n=1 Tax=Sphingobacterium populi TaxID=1812824 RepID=A0ABW5UCK3_9SPHI|nr:hypothetical protein [Sphingobacterium sp. CFCC 11742]